MGRQQQENDPLPQGLGSLFIMHLVVVCPVDIDPVSNGMMNSPKTTVPTLRTYDQTSKLIDSSASRGLDQSQIPIPWLTKGYYDYYMEVEGQTSMTDTFDNLFVSILSKKKNGI